MVDTSLQSEGSCFWRSWWFWARLWWHPSQLLFFGCEVNCLHLRSIDRPALLERFRVCHNSFQENPPREHIKCLQVLILIPPSHWYTQFKGQLNRSTYPQERKTSHCKTEKWDWKTWSSCERWPIDRKYQSSIKGVSMRQYCMENYDNTKNSAFIWGQGPSSNSKTVEVQFFCGHTKKVI